MPHQSAILGSIPQGSAVTPQSVRENATVQEGGIPGHLKRKGADYVLTVSEPKQNLPLCRYLLKPASGGWHLGNETVSCASYHGQSWGYSGPLPSLVLKKVP
jgi:hypothetical protein